jgi:hypothetical protein
MTLFNALLSLLNTLGEFYQYVIPVIVVFGLVVFLMAQKDKEQF